jgi:signal peptidase I
MSETLPQNKWVFVKPFTFLSSDIKRNDIIQLALPFIEKDTTWQKGLFFKRVVALPGDTVKINKSVVFVNGQAIEMNNNLLHNYIIKLKQKKDTMFFIETNISEKYLIDDSCVYLVTLTQSKFSELKNKGISIKENAEDSGLYDETIFPNYSKIKWNKDFFGPLYIPKKGDVVKLDTSNFMLYKRIICDYEGEHFSIEGNYILINQSDTVTSYQVKQNYYFVIGDNFDNSIDSRYWGFIPEKAIRSKLLH